MKKLLFIFLAGLLITGCSDDPDLFDSINDYNSIVVDEGVNANPEALQPYLVDKIKKQKINVKGSGFFKYDELSELCEKEKIYVEVHGTGKTNQLGNFDLFLSYCRDEDGPVTIPEGYQMYNDKDLLYTSLRYENGKPVEGEDKFGFYLVFDYDGGTGIFKNAKGWVKLYFEFDDPVTPTVYENSGKGFLTY